MKIKTFFTVVFIFISVILKASDTLSRVVISDVLITGNKKTKTYIIKREMLFKAGDTLQRNDLNDLLVKSRDLIYNTGLFTNVELTPIENEPGKFIIVVDVKEKWYIYPLPQFNLIARNFNDWVETYDASLERVIYGIKFTHYNLSGRRDKLNIYLLNGYSKNVSINYSAPYSNPKLNRGFAFNAGFISTRNISYNTSGNNKLLQYASDKFINKNVQAGAAYYIRNGYYGRHTISASVNYLSVDKFIIDSNLNKNYFGKPAYSSLMPDFSYTFQYIKVDNIKYPLQGILFTGQFLKRGIGFSGGTNMTKISASAGFYLNHKKNWYSNFSIQAVKKFPNNLAYINQNAFGYGDYNLRGLEYYVIDGPYSTLGKYTLKKKIVYFKIPLPFNLKTIPFIPVTIFGKTYFDAGYVYNIEKYKSPLNNKFLYSGGIGIDILSVYDISLRIEYSFNQLNEKGVFLHSSGGF
ncbi:MAG: hypothetical protein JSR00_03680 [Bacteroidetes bacterium]|nr:hypothetical protein [Bacteroidota bacterium]